VDQVDVWREPAAIPLIVVEIEWQVHVSGALDSSVYLTMCVSLVADPAYSTR
jgi:hypothetical protein